MTDEAGSSPEREALLRELTDNISQCVYVSSPDTRTLFASRAYEEIWGRSRDSVMAQPRSWFDAIHPDDKAAVTAALDDKTADRFEVEYRVVRPDGSIRWVNDRGIRLRDRDGRPHRIMGIVQDITDRRGAEDALKATASENATALRLATDALRRHAIEQQVLLDMIPAMVWIKDIDNLIVRANRRAAAASGHRLEDIENRSTYDLFPADAAKYHKDDLEVIHSGKPKLGIVEELVAVGGDKRWIQTDKVPYFDDAGKPIGVVVFAQDISERKREEARLQALAGGLRAIIEMADELIVCADMDTFYRRAVELARERLGVERCAIFMFEERVAWGTFGTDMRGNTTDERKNSFDIVEEWEEHFATIRPEKSRWVMKEHADRWNWEGTGSRVVGQGWVSYTAIARAGRRALALFIHDAAITNAPFDRIRQELVAVYCSLLAEIIEQKKSAGVLREREQNFRTLAGGLRSVIDMADALIQCPDVDTTYRRMVELVRETLGVERAALFIEDGDMIQGTYGTDLEGRTTDEHSLRFPGDEGWRTAFRQKDSRELWRLLPDAPIYAWTGEGTSVVGHGWVACTPIAQPGQEPMALFCNDAGITGKPFEPLKQDLIAVLCSMMANILRRRRAEGVLRESEKKFRTLAETVEASIFLFQGAELTYVNPAATRISGYSQDELQSMKFWDLIHPEFQQLVKERGLARQRGERVPTRYELKIRTKQGEDRWVDYSSNVVDFDGRTAVLGVAFDITERKRAEEQLFRRVEFERITLRVATDLGNLAGGTMEKRVSKALSQIAGLLGAQTGSLLFFSDDSTILTEVHEWRVRGVASVKEFLHEMRIERARYVTPRLLAGETVRVNHIADLPVEADFERKVMTGAGIRSFVAVPVLGRGRVSGCLTLGRTRKDHCWDDESIGFLKLVGEILFNAIYRERLEEEHARLANKVLELQEEERKKLSDILHDDVGQILTLAAMELGAVKTTDRKSAAIVRRAAKRARSALDVVRDLAGSLRPPTLDEFGIADGLKALCREYNQRGGLRVNCLIKSTSVRLTTPQCTCLFRVVQEALTNAARHARAKRVEVSLHVNKGFAVLEVIDNGCGFNVGTLTRRRGIGLIGMKERLASCGGTLDIQSSPGRGTRIRATIPIRTTAGSRSL